VAHTGRNDVVWHTNRENRPIGLGCRLKEEAKKLANVFIKKCPNVFVISCAKRGRFWLNFVHRFRNKFPVECYQRFIPHLNNVFTWNSYRTSAIFDMLLVEIMEFIHLLWSTNSPDLNLVDYILWKLLQENVCKTDLNELNHRVWTES